MPKIKSQAASVKWSTANVTFKGSNVQENLVSTQEICLNSTVDNVVLFPTRVNFDMAMKICRLLGGEMPLAISDQDLAWAFTSKNRVTLNTACSEDYWMPIVRCLFHEHFMSRFFKQM